MNILYTIRQKGRVTILMILVFFLVVFSSYTYNKNISQMSELSSEMYSDRLMAQDYIYSLMKLLYERKFRLADQNRKAIDDVRSRDRIRILSLLKEYEKTKLTTNENIRFQEFKKNILLMMLSEQQYSLSGNKDEKAGFLAFQNKLLTVSLEQLDELAKNSTVCRQTIE